jgi:hypothetical protein
MSSFKTVKVLEIYYYLGGMVDPGESVSATLKREFMEEAMDSTNLELGDQAGRQIFAKRSNVFEKINKMLKNPKKRFHSRNFRMSSDKTVLGICDILVQIRIRGSVSLTNGSGSGSDFFLQ